MKFEPLTIDDILVMKTYYKKSINVVPVKRIHSAVEWAMSQSVMLPNGQPTIPISVLHEAFEVVMK